MRICKKCGHKDPKQIAADERYREKRLRRLKSERAARRPRRAS